MKAGSGVTRRGLLAGAAAAMLATSWKRSFATSPRSPIRFVDITKPAGITFRHENAASSQKYLIETMGAGCAWIDFDQNGLLDLYLVNSAATQDFKPGLPLRRWISLTAGSRIRKVHSVPQQRGWHLYRCDGACRSRQLRQVGVERRLVRLRQRRLSRPASGQLRGLVAGTQLLLRQPRGRNA